jgi:hypothetical protein
MKKITPIILYIGLTLGFVTTANATDSLNTFSAEDKDGINISTKLFSTQEIAIEALVEPYMERIENKDSTGDSQKLKPNHLNVWIIADDQNGHKIYYDQNTKHFGLAKKIVGLSGTPYATCSMYKPNELTKIFLARK